MDEPGLIHDTARATAAHIVELFSLRDEERKDAFDEVYARVKAGLEAYVAFRRREFERRSGPPNCN